MIDIKKAIVALAGNEVDFVIIGGVALALHSAAYVTYDIDICFLRSRGNIEKIVNALRPFGPRPRGFPKGLPFSWDASTISQGTNFSLETTIGDFDLLGEVEGIGVFTEVMSFAETWKIYGYDVKILSVDGLIRAMD